MKSVREYILWALVALPMFVGTCACSRIESKSSDQDGALAFIKCRNLYDDNKTHEAYSYCEEAANLGWVSAQKKLGWMYSKGEGIKQDHVKAFYWWNKAAIQGNPCASHNIGLSYMKGRGVEKNEEEGIKWIQSAANKGNSYSLHYLG